MQIELEKLKFKQITQEERQVYIRRLLRFKYPPDKKYRVYKQILTSHSIEPKISNKIFDTLKPAEIDKMVSEIWNYSLCKSFDFNINLFKNDVRCFNSKKMLEDILGMGLSDVPDKLFLQKIFLSCGYDYPCEANSYDDFYISLQNEYPLVFEGCDFSFVKKMILVEGATEEILLPKFAQICGFDFLKEGVFLVASGGKNQVVKDYLFNRENLNLPIAIVLDSDAKEQYESILTVIRKKDNIFLLKEGEFEDLLCEELILKALNMEFKNVSTVTKEDLSGDLPMTQKLSELYKIKGFGEFKKVEFAKMIFDAVTNRSELGDKFENLVDFLR